MVEVIRNWVNQNVWTIFSAIIPLILAGSWWLSKLDDRVFQLENRPSPFDQDVGRRLTIVETNQQTVLHRLDTIESKIDKIGK